MSIWLSDTFTEASQISLSSHTPDTVTNSATWVLTQYNTVGDLSVNTNGEIQSSGTNNATIFYSINITDGINVRIKATLSAIQTDTTTKGLFFCNRYIDLDNNFHLQLLGPSHAQNAFQLFKKVSGTITQIASSDDSPTATSVIEFTVLGDNNPAGLEVVHNGIVIITADSADFDYTQQQGVFIAYGGQNTSATQLLGTAAQAGGAWRLTELEVNDTLLEVAVSSTLTVWLESLAGIRRAVNDPVPVI